EDYARRVWKRMRAGTLAEFSFAYDVVRGKQVDNGDGVEPRYVYELEEVDLLEVGPCLFGVNPETELISVRGLKAALAGEGREDALQELHDMLVELGAKCLHDDTPDDVEGGAKGEAGDGKPEEPGASTLAARVAIELMDAGIEV
ncbi:MAG: hypothetical protein GX649_00480, partial [Chloroflexi bacterium]|nr:hypothetical protein [Chloroflexota bacterium]